MGKNNKRKMITVIGSLVGRPWVICTAILVIAIGHYADFFINKAIDNYQDTVKAEAQAKAIAEAEAEAKAKLEAEQQTKVEAEIAEAVETPKSTIEVILNETNNLVEDIPEKIV